MGQLPRIAYLTPNAILPPNRGGRIRAHHLWRAMSAYADVVPIIVGDSPPAYLRHLSRAAEAQYFPRRGYKQALLLKALERGEAYTMPGLWEVAAELPLPPEIWAELGQPEALMRHCLNPARVERLLRRLRRLRPDLVVLCDSSLGLLAAHVRALGVKTVVGPHNFDSGLYRGMAAAAPDDYLRKWNEKAAAAFAATERLYAPHIDQLWVCSAADAVRFAQAGIRARDIKLIPNVYDVGLPTPLPEDSNDLVFIGQANYYPNEDAIRRLFGVSRALDARGVAHRMRIIGRIGEHMRALAADAPSVEILGEVPAVGPYLERAVLAPVALTMGGGTRLKILEAMALGRPVLTTPIGIEGIEAENGVHAVIEPEIDAFAGRIEELLRDRAQAQRIATAGWEFVREHYSHAALLGYVGEALRALGLNDSGRNASAFARNIGAVVVRETAQFNPLTRLLSWVLLLRLAATHEAVAAEFDIGGAIDVANAFIAVKERPAGLVGLEATAVLPPGVEPQHVGIAVHAFGNLVLRHPAPPHILQECAGLVSVDADERGVHVRGWTTSSTAMFTPRPAQASTLAPQPGSNVAVMQAHYDTLSTELAVHPLGGTGQNFNDMAKWLGQSRSSTARLQQFKDRHAGETAWLIGNGPSVRPADLDRLTGRLTFCFNRFHLAFAQTSLRPDYTLAGDKQMIEDFGQEIVDASGGTVFIAHDVAPDLLGNYIWLRQLGIFPPLFSRNANLAVSPGGSTPYVAMQLAYYMGVRKFYFYGADFSFRFVNNRATRDNFRMASGEGNHFISNYRGGRPWCPPSLKDIGASFLAARTVMEAEQGFVRNVTRGGLLEIFEREDFDAALASDRQLA